LPDDAVGGFAAGYWSQALSSREDAAMLQFSEFSRAWTCCLWDGRYC
jgi:hypothetical protein